MVRISTIHRKGAGKGAISGGKGVAAASGAAVGNIAGRIKGTLIK